MRGQVCSSSCLSNNKVALPRQGAWRRREFGWPIGNAPRKDEPRFTRNSELFTVLVRYVCAPAALATFPLRPTSRARPPLPALVLSFVRAPSGLLAVEPHSCACIVVCSLV